jgi:hypothetical protein
MQFTLLKIHTLDYLRSKIIDQCLQEPHPVYQVPVNDLPALIRQIKMRAKSGTIITKLYQIERPDDPLVPYETVDGTRLLPATAPVFYEDVNKVSPQAAMAAWLTHPDDTWTWAEHYPVAADRLQYLHYGWAYECPVIKPFLCLATYLIAEEDEQQQTIFHLDLPDMPIKSLQTIVNYYRPDVTLAEIQSISRTIQV